MIYEKLRKHNCKQGALTSSTLTLFIFHSQRRNWVATETSSNFVLATITLHPHLHTEEYDFIILPEFKYLPAAHNQQCVGKTLNIPCQNKVWVYIKHFKTDTQLLLKF